MLCASESKKLVVVYSFVFHKQLSKAIKWCIKKNSVKCKIVLIQNICRSEQLCISLNRPTGTISMAVLSSLAKC